MQRETLDVDILIRRRWPGRMSAAIRLSQFRKPGPSAPLAIAVLEKDGTRRAHALGTVLDPSALRDSCRLQGRGALAAKCITIRCISDPGAKIGFPITRRR